MRLSIKEKFALYELLDVMTDADAKDNIDRFNDEVFRRVFLEIFLKVRMELRGF